MLSVSGVDQKEQGDEHDLGENPWGGGVLPYMGYIGMCGPKGYGFRVFWS